MSDVFTPVDVQTNDVQDPLEHLVGEGKKYADATELAKSKIEADRFIDRLKSELAELRQEVTKSTTIDEILTQIRQSQTQQPQPGTPQEPREPANPQTPDIEQLVESIWTKKKTEEVVSQNQKIVSDKLRERFGSEAEVHVNKTARELGMALEELRELASKSPQAFFRLTNLDKPVQQVPPTPAPRNQVNTMTNLPSGKRDRAYYERLKAQDRKVYFSQDVQLQMYKDMEGTLRSGGQW